MTIIKISRFTKLTQEGKIVVQIRSTVLAVFDTATLFFYFLRDAPLPFLIFCRYSPPLGICILTTRNICSASLTSWGQPSRAPFGENKWNYAFFDHIARLNDKLTRYTLNNIARILLKISFPLIFTSYHTLIEIGMLF